MADNEEVRVHTEISFHLNLDVKLNDIKKNVK